MDYILYYLVQVDHRYYQEGKDSHIFTDDEEHAFAFTNYVAASQLASVVNGAVLTREVSYRELEDLSAQYKTEYEALSKEERNMIEALCRELRF